MQEVPSREVFCRMLRRRRIPPPLEVKRGAASLRPHTRIGGVCLPRGRGDSPGSQVAGDFAMQQETIGAEVVPQPGKAVEAAKSLQKLGFKVLHVGNTSVSVQAPESVWRDNFSVTFESRSKPRHPPSQGDAVSYRRPVQDPVPI